MGENPLISIVIPCYNDAEYIEQAVQSALHQSYRNKEVIVVDDGSNKKTKALLKALEPKIALLITQENKGPSAARNIGIEAAKGKYILVLDSDDYFELGFCGKAINSFHKNPDVKLVTCYARWFGKSNNYQIYKPRGGSLTNFLLHNSSIGNALFLRKDWETAGKYDETMTKGYEDWEFYIRLHKNGGTTFVIPEVLFHYRNKKDSRNKIANQNKYELLEYICLKHAELYKANFPLFIAAWLHKMKKDEHDKQHVIESPDYKIGNKILRPFRVLGFLGK